MERILLICYGNPARLDDGLGPAFASALEAKGLPGVAVEVDYQLWVEHAAQVAQFETVVFVDATVSGPEPFALERIEPRPALSFSSHSVEPAAVLDLARSLFASEAEGYALAIRGYDFDDFGERLSSPAQQNLAAAVDFAVRQLEAGALTSGVREVVHN